MTSQIRLFRRACAPLLAAAVAAPLTVAAPASAAPAPDFQTTTINGGITSGGQLAVDSQRRAVFVADGDSWSKKINGRVWPVPRPLNPKIAVLNADTRRVTRTIDYLPLPAGSMNAYGVRIPSPQVPAGLALDTRRGLIVTTNAQSNGAAIVPMSARAARPSDIVRSDGPLAHPMGTTVDPVTGLVYIAVFSRNLVAVIDPTTRRQVDQIPGLYKASVVTVDAQRRRLYVGNADTKNSRGEHYVAVVDLPTKRVVKKIPTPQNTRPSVDPATGLVYLTSFKTGEIGVLDPTSLTVGKRIQTNSTPVTLAIDSRRGLGYTSNLFSKSISVVDLTTATVLTTIKTAGEPHTPAVDARTGTVFLTQFQSPDLIVLTARR